MKVLPKEKALSGLRPTRSDAAACRLEEDERPRSARERLRCPVLSPICRRYTATVRRCGADRLKTMVPRGGFEPPTRGFSVRCSTN